MNRMSGVRAPWRLKIDIAFDLLIYFFSRVFIVFSSAPLALFRRHFHRRADFGSTLPAVRAIFWGG